MILRGHHHPGMRLLSGLRGSLANDTAYHVTGNPVAAPKTLGQ